MSQPFHTIGHSTRALADFIGLLHESEIELLVDIRSIPKSRTHPQFNLETLPGPLVTEGIGYTHIAALGGRRAKRHSDEPSPNGFWNHSAFRNYADYALGDVFREGFATLVSSGREHRCAIMCSEAVWWRCHRRIVTDYLLARGETVLHIMAAHQVSPASLTPGAVPQAGGTVLYPR
jgi:uncharacterized protein (DUF488 family)